jgi:hypothetical protein
MRFSYFSTNPLFGEGQGAPDTTKKGAGDITGTLHKQFVML